MKAMICRAHGEPESLEYGDLPTPATGPDEVRIAVRAAGVNFPDILVVQGKYQFKTPFPFAPGMECAGEIVETGANVTHLRPGDRVAAHPWNGCFAEQVVAPAATAFKLPDGIDLATAAACPVTYGTVYHALVDRGELRADDTLLVLGAAGGVGLNAVEIGKLLGARVIAAAGSADKLALCREYGADETVDYGTGPLRDQVKALTGGRGADVIFDAVGGDMTDAAMRCINWQGRLLIIGFAGGRIARVPANLALLKGVALVGVAYQSFANRDPAASRTNMATLLDWLAAGRLRPHISMRFPLPQAPDAMRAIAERRSTGKVVLLVDEPTVS